MQQYCILISSFFDSIILYQNLFTNFTKMLFILRKMETYFQLKTEIVWKNASAMFLLHLFGLYGFFLIPSTKFLSLFWAWFIALCADTAVSSGAHRLWCHRTYKAKLPMRIMLMLIYMMAGQYSLVQWARDHRTHHLYTDTDADPHNAKRGLFYSHVGWLCMKRHPDCKAAAKKVDVSDLYKDPVIRFHQKYYYILAVIVHAFFPQAVAYYVFGESLKNCIFVIFFFRTVLSLNMVWCVNSLAHYWGDKPYNKDILASQNAIMAFFLVGEGWHNFHHTFPFDYRIGERGQGNQFAAYVIEVCEKLGLASNLRCATQKEIDRAVENNKKKIREEVESGSKSR